MYGNNNNKIEIEAVENGYIVTIILQERRERPIDMVNQFMPLIERIQNKTMGEDWKNDVMDQANEIIAAQPPKPIRQFVCADWDAVLKIINENKI